VPTFSRSLGKTPYAAPVRSYSHSYLLFRGGEVVQGEKPFRFQAAWLTHEGIEEVIKEACKLDTMLYPLLCQVAASLRE